MKTLLLEDFHVNQIYTICCWHALYTGLGKNATINKNQIAKIFIVAVINESQLMYFDVLYLCDSYEFVLKSNHIPVLNSAVEDWIVLNRNRHYTAFLCEFREVSFLMRAHYYCITSAASLVLYLESCQENISKFNLTLIIIMNF